MRCPAHGLKWNVNQLAAHAFLEISTQGNSATGVAGGMTPSPRLLKSLALLLLATPARTAFTAMAGFVAIQPFANNGLELSAEDAGQMKSTQNDADRGKFKVPSLRKSALTAPYMHDGQFGTPGGGGGALQHWGGSISDA